jgi:hypothetical protein
MHCQAQGDTAAACADIDDGVSVEALGIVARHIEYE